MKIIGGESGLTRIIKSKKSRMIASPVRGAIPGGAILERPKWDFSRSNVLIAKINGV